MVEQRVSILAVLRDQISRPLNKVNGAFQKLSARLTAIDKKFTAVGKKITDFGRRLVPLSVAIGAVGVAVTKFAADFDKAITQSTSIIDGLTKALDKDLRDAAKLAARDVPQSAAQIAESFFFLASAGLDAQQSIAALPAVIAFATAGQFDLATATDLSTDALSALGLASDDTTENLENLVRVTDVLVKANTLANATVQQFSESLTNRAGAQLRLFNKDVEEGVAVLAVFADQGVKGAVAGQQLFQVLRDLSAGAVNNAKGFVAARVSVFDTTGQFRNLADVIEDLEKSLAGLSTEQAKIRLGLLGIQERSLGALLQLVGFSEKIREYQTALEDAGGTTERVADKQLQNLADQFTILIGRLQLAAIEIGEALGPALEILFRILETGIEFVEDLVQAFKDLSPTMRAIVGLGGALLAVLGPLLIVVGVLVTSFGSFAGILAFVTGSLSFLVGPLALLAGALAGAAIGLGLFSSDAEEATDDTIDFQRSVEDLREELVRLDEQLQDNAKGLTKIRAAVVDAQRRLDALGISGGERDNPVVEAIRRQLRDIIRAGEAQLEVLEAARESTTQDLQATTIERTFRRLKDQLDEVNKTFQAQRGLVADNRRELERAEKELRIFETAQRELLKVLDPSDGRLRDNIIQTEDLRKEVIRLRTALADAARGGDENADALQKQARATLLLADANRLLQATLPGNQLTSIARFAEQASERLRQVRADTAAQVQSGLISVTEALALEQDALDTFTDALTQADNALATFSIANQSIIRDNPLIVEAIEVLRLKLQDLETQGRANIANQQDFFLGLKQGVQSAAQQFNTLQKAGVALGNTLATSLTEGIIDVFIDGRKSLQEFAIDFIKTIAKLILQILIFNALSAATGGVSIFTPAAANRGGLMGRRGVMFANDGSMVPGRGPNRDSIPAVLTPGEYVHNRAAVDYYGPNVMQALNRRMIPRDLLGARGGGITSALRRGFQTGGMVGGNGNGNGEEERMPTPAFLIADEQTAERLFAGGPNARRRMLEEEADFLRGIIGGQI